DVIEDPRLELPARRGAAAMHPDDHPDAEEQRRPAQEREHPADHRKRQRIHGQAISREARCRYSMRQASSNVRRGLRGKTLPGSPLPRLQRKFDFQRPSGKKAASTLALSKPDIGPVSMPIARAAMMR